MSEVERLIFRHQVSKRAQYYATTFLNQIVLSNRTQDQETANYLIGLYFKLFQSLVVSDAKEDKKEVVMAEGVEAKMMGALLVGVNRAFPFAQLEDEMYISF